jgi:Histidine kinase
MTRSSTWLQLLLGWIPMGVLFAALILTVHGGSVSSAAVPAAVMMITAAILGVFAHRFTLRFPWPHPMRAQFIAIHFIAACVYALTWFAANAVINSVIRTIVIHHENEHVRLAIVIGGGVLPMSILGVWVYVMIAGLTYANRATQRAAQIEASAARSQLDALRAQLHPHFLFNALHTVVQLIPIDGVRATRAAEELADMLRTALTEQRDVVDFDAEWTFVQRYLAIETLRFGDRLRIVATIDADASRAWIPAFALQTLVENAVRHAAAPRTETTTLKISASTQGDLLAVTVSDDGSGIASDAKTGIGTGLARLRERLKVLCGDDGALKIESVSGVGVNAGLKISQRSLRAAVERSDD